MKLSCPDKISYSLAADMRILPVGSSVKILGSFLFLKMMRENRPLECHISCKYHMLSLTSNHAKVRQKRQLRGNNLIWFLNSIKVDPQACLPCLRLFSCLPYSLTASVDGFIEHGLGGQTRFHLYFCSWKISN
jgi:hypothetical protein